MKFNSLLELTSLISSIYGYYKKDTSNPSDLKIVSVWRWAHTKKNEEQVNCKAAELIVSTLFYVFNYLSHLREKFAKSSYMRIVHNLKKYVF